MQYKVPFIKPSFPSTKHISLDYKKILANNWFTNFGPFEREFATKVGNYIGKEYLAATFSSATAGMIASIIAVLDRGDNTKYVVMPSFTFASAAEALIWCGYKPAFIDIEESGLHMDLGLTKKALEEHGEDVACILFCNSFGVGTTEIEAWEELSKKTGVPLIIDSAAGFGSLYSKSRKVGTAGVCEVFSFHATKPFAIGEGGAVVCRDEALVTSLQSIENFGFNRKKNTTNLGFNGKLQEINAAIGLRQLNTFEGKLKGRKAVFERYAGSLNPKKYRLQNNAENASLCFAAVVVTDGSRDRCLAKLEKLGVQARTYYSPSLHKQSYFKDEKTFSQLTNTNNIDDSILSLPIHDNMRQEDISLIIKALND